MKLIGITKTQHQMVMNRDSFTPAAKTGAQKVRQHLRQPLQQLRSQHLVGNAPLSMPGFDHRTTRLMQAQLHGGGGGAAAQQARHARTHADQQGALAHLGAAA